MKDVFHLAHREAVALLRIARRDWKAAAAMTVIEACDEVNWGFQLQPAMEKARQA